MDIPQIDWKIASLGVMVLVGIFNIISRKFFEKEDWRVFIPLLAIAALAMTAYFVLSYREVKITQSGVAIALVMGVFICITAALTAMVYADKSAPLSVAMPIMGMSVMVTAVIAVAFMGEPLTLKTVAGVLLAVIAIFLLAG